MQKWLGTVSPELASYYQGRRVLVTGSTGFKGSWLYFWLQSLGAEVYGMGLPPSEYQRPLYDALGLGANIECFDIREVDVLKQYIQRIKPEIIFHLAAQPLVKLSYDNPIETYDINTAGTLTVLDAMRESADVIKAGVMVTSDKCYRDTGEQVAHGERDALGGHDPYSASKACAEIMIESYRRSYLADLGVGIASARSGNIIGPGDGGEYRLVPEVLRAVLAKQPVVLRAPKAVRPWQYVMDVLRGYLLLGQYLTEAPAEYSQAFNFANSQIKAVTVEALVNALFQKLRVSGVSEDNLKLTCLDNSPFSEMDYLQLDSSRARDMLEWEAEFDLDQALEQVVGWELQ